MLLDWQPLQLCMIDRLYEVRVEASFFRLASVLLLVPTGQRDHHDTR